MNRRIDLILRRIAHVRARLESRAAAECARRLRNTGRLPHPAVRSLVSERKLDTIKFLAPYQRMALNFFDATLAFLFRKKRRRPRRRG